MSANDDRQTYPARTRGRRRDSCGRDLHWRPGQAHHLMPERHHRASGELHPRRLFGMISVAAAVLGGNLGVPLWTGHYSFQTVFPPTIARTARPFNFQPWKGEWRDRDWKLSTLTVHSRLGSISVTS